jgi:hypothetical protein
VTFTKAGATAATGVKWVVAKLCPGVETCNNIDDDCNGIVDDGCPKQ